MEYLLKGMFGEKSLTKVVGVFNDREKAHEAVGRMLKSSRIAPRQLRVLGPQDASMSRSELFGRSMEPEQRGIFKTLLLTHVVAGLTGAVVGLLLFIWLLRSGQPMVASSPLLAGIAIIGFGATFGLLIGGLLALRPDHVWLITAVRSALKKNQWAVVVHPTDTDQTEVAHKLLCDSGGKVLKSL